MARLTDIEKQAFREAARKPWSQPPQQEEERFVALTVAARMRYIRFATQAARFYKGDKPVRFEGQHWKL